MANKQEGKLRVAVIGTGNMGRNHVRNYFMLPESELVAIADVNPEAKSLADDYKVKFFTDYKEMLEKARPDAVSVVVPTPFHLEVATEVMSRGIHCMLEKPIASSVEEADKLIACAKKNNVTFTVGHIERFNPVIKKLKQMVDDNAIGYIMRINFKETLSSFSSFLYKKQGWIFPVIVLSALISLSTLQISGTSAGIYDYLLGKKPVNLIAGKPRPIRSDEWVVTTPFAVSQYNNGMPAKSKDIGIGQDMSIVADAPYTDWSMLFRPHNLIFFLLPIGFAFAFKWWLLSAGLALSVYIFVLFLYPRKWSCDNPFI
jgi:hypothetical protein